MIYGSKVKRLKAVVEKQHTFKQVKHILDVLNELDLGLYVAVLLNEALDDYR